MYVIEIPSLWIGPGQGHNCKACLPLTGFGMGEFRDQPQAAGFDGNRILAESDAVIQKCLPA